MAETLAAEVMETNEILAAAEAALAETLAAEVAETAAILEVLTAYVLAACVT